jgi:hypothetical protein
VSCEPLELFGCSSIDAAAREAGIDEMTQDGDVAIVQAEDRFGNKRRFEVTSVVKISGKVKEVK